MGHMYNNDPMVKALNQSINRRLDSILLKVRLNQTVSESEYRQLGLDAQALKRRYGQFRRVHPLPPRLVPEKDELINRIAGRIDAQLTRVALKGSLDALSPQDWRLMALDFMAIRNENRRLVEHAAERRDEIIELMLDAMGSIVFEALEVKLLGKVLGYIAMGMNLHQIVKDRNDD